MHETPPAPFHSLSLALALIVLGLLALLLAATIRQTDLGDNRDPGPRAFPRGLAIFLMLGGAVEAAAWWRQRRGGRSEERPGLEDSARAGNVLEAVILLAALGLYAAAIPWLGFSLSTFLFGSGLMARLGIRWIFAVLVSGMMVGAIHLLFVRLFTVQLPTGVFGLPF